MGDRFYESQRNSRMGEKKPPRKLKSEWLTEINVVLDREVKGLDKCTIDTLTNLLEAIKNAKKV